MPPGPRPLSLLLFGLSSRVVLGADVHAVIFSSFSGSFYSLSCVIVTLDPLPTELAAENKTNRSSQITYTYLPGSDAKKLFFNGKIQDVFNFFPMW